MTKFQVCLSAEHLKVLDRIMVELGAENRSDAIRKALGLAAFVADTKDAGGKIAVIHTNGEIETVRFL